MPANKRLFVGIITNDETLKKFSLKIHFKTFHAGAECGASLADSARIAEKNIIRRTK